jgi:hypothetical protein
MKNAVGLGNPIFGIGYRSPFYGYWRKTPKYHRKSIGLALFQPIRLTFGEMLFKQADKNPLIPKDRYKLTPYIGISLNASIASILGPIGKLLAP